MDVGVIKKRNKNITLQTRNLMMYVMLYFFLQYHEGTLYSNYNSIFRPLVIGGFILFSVCNFKKFNDAKLGLFCCFSAAYIFLISFVNSGETGMSTILELMGTVLIAYSLLIVYKQKIINAYIKIITFFSVISLLFFCVAQIQPDFLLSILHKSLGSKGDIFYGGLFYSIRYVWYYDFRNCGMFTEPGLYCVVLLTAIYLLLFQKRYLFFTKKQYKYLFAILTVTVITTMSTAGIICLGLILLCYILSKQQDKSNGEKNIKKYILFASILLIIAIIADYSLNGMYSFIYNNLLNKISSEQLVIAGNTGNARLTTIEICFDSILRYPFGRGKTYIVGLLPEYAVGAKALVFVASYGIVYALFFYWFIFGKFIKAEKANFYTVISFVILYIVMSMAQSMIIYPCFMLVLLMYRMRWIND